MQVLPSLNMIRYLHDYQDTAIGKIVSYMKAELKTLPKEYQTDKHQASDPRTPRYDADIVETQTVSSNHTIKQEKQNPIPFESLSQVAKTLILKPPDITKTIVQDKMSGAVVKDVSGKETKLREFGIVYNPYGGATLDASLRTALIAERGKASMNITWNSIENVTVSGDNNAKIKLKNGRILETGQAFGVEHWWETTAMDLPLRSHSTSG